MGKRTKKIGIVLISVLFVLLLGACSGNNNEEVKQTKKDNDVTDLSKEPIAGTWTLVNVVVDGQEYSIAQWLASGEVTDVTIYDFTSTGEIKTKGSKFTMEDHQWTKKDGKYYLLSDPDIELQYSNEELSFEYDNMTFSFIKGEKTSEELLKSAGLLHTDEIQISNYTVNDLGSGLFEIVYEIKNNTDNNIVFMGISMKEFDENDTVLNDYYSYNKNAVDTELQPQQSTNLKLTFSNNNGIKKIENTSYRFKTLDGEMIEGKLSNPYIVQL